MGPSARSPEGASREPVILRGHEKDVVATSFSLDGRSIVTASIDGTARVWTIDPLTLRDKLRARLNRAHPPTRPRGAPGARPRVISDNGPQFIAGDFRRYTVSTRLWNTCFPTRLAHRRPRRAAPGRSPGAGEPAALFAPFSSIPDHETLGVECDAKKRYESAHAAGGPTAPS